VRRKAIPLSPIPRKGEREKKALNKAEKRNLYFVFPQATKSDEKNGYKKKAKKVVVKGRIKAHISKNL
jgi:hypothetical protein